MSSVLRPCEKLALTHLALLPLPMLLPLQRLFLPQGLLAQLLLPPPFYHPGQAQIELLP